MKRDIQNDLFHLGYCMSAIRDKALQLFFADRGITEEDFEQLERLFGKLYEATNKDSNA